MIVGAGPAGMAAAAALAEEGIAPVVLDAQRASGGQIWRGQPSTDLHRRFNHLVEDGRIAVRFEAAVVDADRGTLITTAGRVAWDRLILATGARELFLPFPGWTDPRVMGAGGLQAAVKAGLDIRGQRVLLAGSGPLLLVVAAGLKDAGADMIAVCEQAPYNKVARFGLKTAFAYGKLGQAFDLWRRTSRLFRTGTWITEALDQDGLVFRLNSDLRWQEADYIGVAFGLVPNLELPRLLGCRVENGQVHTDEDLRTSRPSVWAVGEATGIGGVDSAVAEGRLAARSAMGLSTETERGEVRKWRAYSRAMEEAYALRPEIKELSRPDTVLCRCEHVPYGVVSGTSDPSEAKLDHRLGMGWCQGRVCGAACSALFGWPEPSVRPPLFPIEAAQYANLLADHDES